MADTKTLNNLLFPKPCRKKVDRQWVKQALSRFVGACGTAATAAVVTMAVSQTSVKAQQPPPPPGIAPAKRVVTTQPATQPASQPATQSSQLTPQQQAEAEKLVAKLDADEVATRDVATKQLKDMGQPVVAFLKDFSANHSLSSEASARVQAIIEAFSPPVKQPPKIRPAVLAGKPVEMRIIPPLPEQNY